MAAWGLGGVVSLIGCSVIGVGERLSHGGRRLQYLTRAYGPKMGFAFAWAELSVIRTGGSIGFMAYVFARYATEFCNLGDQSKLIYALLGIIGLTFVNAIGVRPGRLVQNALTTANIVGLSSIALIGIIWYFLPSQGPTAADRAAADVAAAVGSSTSPLPAAAATTTLPESFMLSFALTMVLVFTLTAVGTKRRSLIGGRQAEVQYSPRIDLRHRPGHRDLYAREPRVSRRARLLGRLQIERDCRGRFRSAIRRGRKKNELRSRHVFVARVDPRSSLHGDALYGTFGKDHKLFAWLSGKDESTHRALGALFAQAVFSILLIAVVELAYHWRQFLNELAAAVGMRLDLDVQTNGDINNLVACTPPVFWLFFLLTGCSLFVLRWKEPNRERPYRVPWYPVLPFVFVASCAFMLYKSTAYALEREPAEAIIVAGLMLLGFPLGILSSRASRSESQS